MNEKTQVDCGHSFFFSNPELNKLQKKRPARPPAAFVPMYRGFKWAKAEFCKREGKKKTTTAGSQCVESQTTSCENHYEVGKAKSGRDQGKILQTHDGENETQGEMYTVNGG